MNAIFTPFLAILKRDLLRESRTGELLLGGAGFGIVVILAYAFSLPSDFLTHEVGVGALWIAVIFASQVAIAGSIEIEGSAGRLDAVRATGIDAGIFYMGKAFSLFITLLLFASGLLLITAFLFNLEFAGIRRMTPVLILGIGGISLSGPLIALLGAGAKSSRVLTPFLYVVLFVPLLLASVMASQSAIEGEVFGAALTVVGAYDLIIGGGVLLVSPVIIEES